MLGLLHTLIRYLRAILVQLKRSIRARVPEKIIIAAAYVSNAILVATQYLLLGTVHESSWIVLLVETVAVFQLLLPALLLDVVPLFHYFGLLGVVAVGSFLNLVPYFPYYYYSVVLVMLLTLVKVEPVIVTSPRLVKIATRMRRALRRARLPRTVEELKSSVKLGFVHIASLAVGVLVYALRVYPPALIVVVYSTAALLFFLLNVGVNPMVKVTGVKHSLPLLFILRYPVLFRLANRMKMRVHRLVERAGILIYELEYVAKYLAAAVWCLMLLPSIYLVLSCTLPLSVFAVVALALPAVPALIYYMPYILLSCRVRARRAAVEKELPVFLAYASALVSAGYTIYHVFRDLALGRGAGLLKAFTREARYFVSLVERQGLPELRALEYYAATHPSSEFRNFLLGYLHQRHLGGRISVYMEQKLVEALDALKRRMENYVNHVVTLTEIALTVLVLPALPMIVGFIIAPDIVYAMLISQMLAFVPAVGVMFYAVANAIQPEFRDEYRFTYVPSVAAGVAGLAVAVLLAQQKLAAGVALVISAIAFGYYVEYARYRRVFGEIEKTLPQLFRDLSELRQLMPIAEALNRMAKMGYPRSVSRILQRIAALRNQGIKIADQPWHSRSWLWRFTQFLLGRIEETGGGTSTLFRQLMMFFTEFNNIMASVRGSLRLYEFVVYAIPAIFALVSYSTLGIFVAMSQVSEAMGVGVAVGGVEQLGIQLPQLMRLLRGVDPAVLSVCDAIMVEVGFVLGLLSGKVISGTLRDTRVLAISMALTAAIVLVAPSLVQTLIAQAMPSLVQQP